MDALILNSTSDTPEVILNPANNHFEISGKSYPEDAIEFFDPIKDWLKKYLDGDFKPFEFNIKVLYLNSISSKMILDIMRILSDSPASGQIKINWYYKEDNEDMMEQGEEFGEMINVPVELIPF